MPSAPREVQAYFESLPNDRREQLGALRSHIRHIWPDAEEGYSFRIPTYSIDGKPVFALANRKAYMVLHVIPYDLLDPFKHELLLYDCGRSCIRFREMTPALRDLLDRVIKYAGSQLHLSRRSVRPTSAARRAILS